MNYDLHGVGVTVNAGDAAVIDAMDHRLKRFRAAVPADGVRLDFVSHEPPAPPGGRPVYDTPHGRLHYDERTDTLWGELAEVHLRCVDGAARFYSNSFTGLPLYLATHPLATVSLMELLERRGLYSLHAACLARDGRGVLLAGPTGSGKSTLTLALLRAGLEFVADDVVFLTGAGEVLGFPDAVGVTPDTAARFPELDGAPAAPGFPKRLARIEDAFPATPAPLRCAPAALLFPRVVHDRPGAIAELDPREAFLRLVPDVLLTHPRTSQAHLQAIAALLERVTCYELASGTDLGRTAQLAAETI